MPTLKWPGPRAAAGTPTSAQTPTADAAPTSMGKSSATSAMTATGAGVALPKIAGIAIPGSEWAGIVLVLTVHTVNDSQMSASSTVNAKAAQATSVNHEDTLVPPLTAVPPPLEIGMTMTSTTETVTGATETGTTEICTTEIGTYTTTALTEVDMIDTIGSTTILTYMVLTLTKTTATTAIGMRATVLTAATRTARLLGMASFEMFSRLRLSSGGLLPFVELCQCFVNVKSSTPCVWTVVPQSI
mmetsp:Transcript_13330/g.40419  ORF Transcript_13330/g.40419 Transcript_13330/m.40419 type:complete len:244 (-) Transcript_13330:429-1160(-)